MIIHYMSASRLKTYLQCPEKYHQQYENHVRGGAEHLTFGTMIHKVFERYLQEDWAREDMKHLYEDEWDKASIANPEYFKDGYDIILNFLKMNQKRDSIVPMGFELPFAIDIESGQVYETEKVDWDNPEDVRAFLDDLKAQDKPIIFGFIDRVEYDLATDTLRIVDYKTSRVSLTQSEADSDIQLSMYALVAAYLFPEYSRVSLELHYVRDGMAVKTSRTDKELAIFQKWLLSIYRKIKDDTVHKAELNKYCGWCDAKAGCVAYQELLNGEAEELDISKLDYDSLDEQLEKINIHAKILDGRKKEIEAFFKDQLKKSDNSPIQTNGGERFVTKNLRTSYDVKSIIRLFPDSYQKYLSVNKTEVDKVAKNDEGIMNELLESSNQYYIAPTLRKKKGKENV